MAVRGGAGEPRGVFPAPGERRLRPRRASRPAPRPLSRGGRRSSRPGPRPSRPGGAARWIVGWGLRRPRSSLRRCLARADRATPGRAGRWGEAKQWSRERNDTDSGRGAVAAAPLEAGDVGEAVAAAAEAALRTRGKLLADRTPGRDVREPPLPPLTPERSWAREGGPVLPGPTGQPARGGGGKPGSGPAGLPAPGGGGRGGAASVRRGGLQAAEMH